MLVFGAADSVEKWKYALSRATYNRGDGGARTMGFVLTASLH